VKRSKAETVIIPSPKRLHQIDPIEQE